MVAGLLGDSKRRRLLVLRTQRPSFLGRGTPGPARRLVSRDPLIPVAAVDLGRLPIQEVQLPLILPDLPDEQIPIARVQTIRQLRQQLAVLHRVLDGCNRRPLHLALPAPARTRLCRTAVHALLPRRRIPATAQLLPQQVQVQLAQGIGAQPAIVVAVAVAHKLVGLEQVGDADEGAGLGAEGHQRLEQQQRLEGRVGGRGGHALGMGRRGVSPAREVAARLRMDGRQDGGRGRAVACVGVVVVVGLWACGRWGFRARWSTIVVGWSEAVDCSV